MNKLRKNFKIMMSFLVVFAMLFSYFIPFINAFAASNTSSLSVSFRGENANYGKVEYSLDDGATWIDINENKNLDISVAGDNLRLKIVPNTDYIVDYAGINLNLDGNIISDLSNLEIENGYIVPDNVQAVSLEQVEFRYDGGEQQGGAGGYQENSNAIINYSVNGVVEYDVGPFDGLGISFRINGTTYRPDTSKINYTEDTAYERDENGQLIMGDNNQPIPILEPGTYEPMREKTGVTVAGDTISYDSSEEKVNFVFTMNPGTLMTSLVINGQTINNLPNTSDELLAHYTDHRIEIEVNNIDKADTYNIEITGRYPNSNEEFMGSFLWDYNPDGYTEPEDKILNGKIEFVKAEYNGHVYTTPEEINALGGVYVWKDAPRKKKYTEEREGCGEAQFPKGTILTVKIVPDSGYQLVDFGINGGAFEPQEEIGTYSFEVGGGPFHLQATIMQVEDVVKTKSEKVSAGAINLGDEQSMSIGTARLDVKDIELTDDQISNFEKAADGYEVKNYLDISLFNTVYKGNLTQSWDTQVKDLDNEAEIFLQLEDDVNGEDIVIVHEKHDGTYEIIPTEYLKEYNAIVFKTKSFSNYAIATKTIISEEINVNNDNISNKTINPKTGDNVMFLVALFGVSIIGFASIRLYAKKN